MLAKMKKSFIDLGKMPEKMEMETSAIPKQDPKPYYPSFYIDKNIGLVDEDLDQEMTAVVKLVPKKISKSVTNGKETYSCDIEVRSIKMGSNG